MPTLPFNIGRKRRPAAIEQRSQDERNIRQMEKYYTERESVMAPDVMDEYRKDDRIDTPARQDYRNVILPLRRTQQRRIRGR